MTSLSTAQKLNLVQKIAEHHARFSKSYFFTPPTRANERRQMERENNFTEEVETPFGTLIFKSYLSCSCKNVYYTGRFVLDGAPTNARCLKKIITALEKQRELERVMIDLEPTPDAEPTD